MGVDDAAARTEILILQHEADCPPANLGHWLDGRGERWRAVSVSDEPLPPVARYRALVVLGSEVSAYDETVWWVLPEREFVGGCIAAGTPVFGICFGAQVLAAVTGGEVSKAPISEFGWTQVAGAHPYAGEWYSWHSDHVTVPDSATVLATSPVSVQAFSVGNSLGVQYHPEVTTVEIAEWKAKNAAALLAQDGPDADAAIDARTREHLGDATVAAGRLYASFFDTVT